MIDPFRTLPILDLIMGRNRMGAATPPFVPPEAAGLPPGAGEEELSPFQRIGTSFQGEEIPPEMAAQLRRRAAVAAGLSLMGNAASGRPASSLAAAFGAGAGALEQGQEGFVERRRQTSKDELSRRATEESITASEESRRRAAAGEEREATKFDIGLEEREGMAGAAAAAVAEIEDIAGADSLEARRARAMAKGGPDLQDDLDKLLGEVIARKQAPEMADEATDIEIAKRRRLFEEDPQLVNERQLAARRVAAYEAAVAAQTGRKAAGVTPTTYFSQLGTETRKMYDVLIKSPENAYPTGMLKEGVDTTAVYAEAQKVAEANLKARIAGMGGPGGGDDSDEAILERGRQVLQENPDLTLEQIRTALLEETNGDAERAQRLLIQLSGM